MKTSLAPARRSSRSTTSAAGLIEPLEALGFHLVGYGCTTCIGNSGPLPEEISDVVSAEDLAVVSVLSRQPQLRGPHQPRREDELPRLAAAVVAYALAGTMDIDLLDEPLGAGRRTATTSSSRTSGRPPRRSRATVEEAVQIGHVPQVLRRGLRGRRALERARGARGRPLRLGRATRPTCASRRSSRTCRREPAARRATSRARACSPCSATRSPPTTSRPRARSRRTRRPAQYLIEHGVEQQGLQLLRRAPRQPRGDGARHVRQHPPAQPARAAATEGGVTLQFAGRRGDDDLRRGDEVRRGRARRWSCSPARSTARAPRATGRPRARSCSACAR